MTRRKEKQLTLATEFHNKKIDQPDPPDHHHKNWLPDSRQGCNLWRESSCDHGAYYEGSHNGRGMQKGARSPDTWACNQDRKGQHHAMGDISCITGQFWLQVPPCTQPVVSWGAWIFSINMGPLVLWKLRIPKNWHFHWWKFGRGWGFYGHFQQVNRSRTVPRFQRWHLLALSDGLHE